MTVAEATEADCRARVRHRSAGFCEAAIPGVCIGRGESMHHRFKAGQGGRWVPANILHTCGDGTRGCHGWIEANPDDAEQRGMWIKSGDDPAAVPVLIAWRGIYAWFRLDNAGGLTWPGKHR